jgi:hypothetical protein
MLNILDSKFVALGKITQPLRGLVIVAKQQTFRHMIKIFRKKGGLVILLLNKNHVK